MAKWIVTKTLSRRQGGFIHPGETVELPDIDAAKLLKLGALVLPYVRKPTRVIVKTSKKRNELKEQ